MLQWESDFLKNSQKVPLTNAGWVVELIKDKINVAGGNLPKKWTAREGCLPKEDQNNNSNVLREVSPAAVIVK